MKAMKKGDIRAYYSKKQRRKMYKKELRNTKEEEVLEL